MFYYLSFCFAFKFFSLQVTEVKFKTHTIMYFIFFVNYLLFTSVYCLPANLTATDIMLDYKISTTDESSKQIAEQEVDFNYHEDYSHFKINSQENIDYIEYSTQKMDSLINDTMISAVTNTDEYDLSNLQTITNYFAEEDSYDNKQSAVNQLAKIFNVGHVSIEKKMPVDFMPPQFMTDLYHTLTERNNDALNTIAYGASTIISLPETNPSTPGLFKFDLSGISNQDILEAELHVYRIGREVSIPLHHSPYYLLRVYQVLPNDNLMSWNPDVHQLLNVHYVSSFITGWQVFKVKRALDSWLNESAPNLGFLITASTVVNEPIDINFARKDRFSNKYQPSLVLFTKPKENLELISHNYYPSNNNMEMNNQQSLECSKKPLYVDFTGNYFENFIIEPKGFEAHQCTGKCIHPENLNSPNYSLLKSALNSLETISSNICCVPETMKYLIVLYLSGDKIVLQQIENMIVETCSCR